MNNHLKICFLIAASPTDGFFSQVGIFRLALNSLGGMYKEADIFLSLGDEKITDIPNRWSQYLDVGVIINWADPSEFQRIGKRAQGENKWLHDYSAYDLIIFSDADTILLTPIDELLFLTKEKKTVTGVIAHYPFPYDKNANIDELWQFLSNEFTGKDIELAYNHTLPAKNSYIKCPFYLNFGFVIMAPSIFMTIRDTYLSIRSRISPLLKYPIFSGQIALTLAIHKHNVPTHSAEMRYNFPNDPIAEKLYPGQLDNVSVIHYLRTDKFDRQKIFTTEKAFNKFLSLDLQGSNKVFQGHIRAITRGLYPFEKQKKKHFPQKAFSKRLEEQNKPDKSRRLIVVLGMHRSGTSVITRGLQTLGVDLGNSLLPVQKDNPRGFWEDADINTLNIEILDFLGKDWHFLSPIQPEDIDILRDNGYQLRASTLLQQKMNNSQIFGFKDPRLAKLALFWKEVFTHSQFDVSYVISIRHPLSVCESLAKRHNFEFERSYLLWMEHLITSFVNTIEKKSVVVDFDSMMISPEAELIRIANKLNLQVNHTELNKFKNDFLDNKLRHTTYQLDDLKLDHTAPPLVTEIYSKALGAATDKIELDAEEFKTSVREWNEELSRQKTALLFADKLEMKIIMASQSVEWKFALLLRRFREKLFPLGSYRTKLAKRIYASFRTWRSKT